MPRRRSPARLLLTATLASAALAFTGVSIAQACGGFFRAKTVDPEQQPSLSREKVLLIHDAETGQQQFIREVAFERATEPFGFVVPTPTRPTVDEVATTPFTQLRRRFPFSPPPPTPRGGGGNSKSAGSGSSRGVEVLEVKTVGSFTAFVLAATDAEALSTWLADNQLTSTKEADAWLAHYVDMGFYYVAMRYDPPKPDEPDAPTLGNTVVAETMRIGFATPLPYYPYLEPAQPTAAGPGGRRLMELWYVGTAPVTPVALHEADGQRRWVQPLRAGDQYDDAREQLALALEPELSALLPSGTLVLQTFQDQKTSRPGFQDVLFVGQEPSDLSREQLRPLLAILDPSLAGARP